MVAVIPIYAITVNDTVLAAKMEPIIRKAADGKVSRCSVEQVHPKISPIWRKRLLACICFWASRLKTRIL